MVVFLVLWLVICGLMFFSSADAILKHGVVWRWWFRFTGVVGVCVVLWAVVCVLGFGVFCGVWRNL